MNPLLTLAAAAALTLATAPAGAADDPAAPDNPAEADGAAEMKDTMDAAVLALGDFDDRAFEQYVDLNELDGAWTFLNAPKLAEIGIDLARAEGVLFREHPLVSSEDVLKVAARTAGVKNDPDTLETLREFAEKTGRDALLERIDVASALTGRSRAAAPAVDLDELTIGALIAYKQARLDFDAAIVHNDAEMLKELSERVAGFVEKSPAVWTKLNEEIREQVELAESLGAPSRGGPGDVADATEALNLLSGASRGGPPWGNPYPNQGYNPGFNPGFPPSGGQQWQQQQRAFGYERGTRTQRPGMAALGGLFQGLSAVKQMKGGAKNAQKGVIFQHLGQALQNASGQSNYFDGYDNRQSSGGFQTGP